MSYSFERREQIFDRSSGLCHLCRGRLSWCNYGLYGERGAWEVEHSRPKSRGGTDHLNNLYAAHIKCNRSKQAELTRRVRASYGHTRAPLSVSKRARIRSNNAATGAFIGGAIGSVVGPLGAFVGAIIGREIGSEQDIED